MSLLLLVAAVMVVARILYFYMVEERRWKKYKKKLDQKITELNKESEEIMRRECLELKSKLKPGEILVGCDKFMEEE